MTDLELLDKLHEPLEGSKPELTEKEERRLASLTRDYNLCAINYGLEGKDRNEQVHILVDEYNKMRDVIDKEKEKVSDFYSQAYEITEISKQTFNDFVKITVMMNNDKVTDKFMRKFEDDFNSRLLDCNLRNSFLKTISGESPLEITDLSNNSFTESVTYRSADFDDILEHASQCSEHLSLMQKELRRIVRAAEYLTELDLKAKDFKLLAEFEYTKNGGKPKPGTPSKLWKVFESFSQVHRLITKYGYTEQANKCKLEFGLEVTEKTPRTVSHPWDATID